MRLIDADELKKKIRRCDDSATRATFDYVYDDDIDDAPTVDVLDNIRAEILSLPTDTWNMVRRTKVLDIIDKYR